MRDFIYNKIKTADRSCDNSGVRPLFSFAVDDYIAFLNDKGKCVPDTIAAVGVILEEGDTQQSVENFINMINNNPDCDLVIFGLNMLPEEYDVDTLCKPLYTQHVFEELPNVYLERLVFYRKKLIMDCDILEELKDICELTLYKITKMPYEFLASQKNKQVLKEKRK